jgi:hypothetical protein
MGFYKSLSNILKDFINLASYKTKKNGCFVDKIRYGYITYILTDTTDGRVLTIVNITLNRVPLPRINGTEQQKTFTTNYHNEKAGKKRLKIKKCISWWY